MKENKVITNIEQLTPEWLTSIFKNNGYLSKGKVIFWLYLFLSHYNKSK